MVVSKHAEARRLLERGRALLKSAPEEAIDLIHRALDAFHELEQPRGQAECLLELSIHELRRADFAEALRLAERAVIEARRAGDPEGEGMGLHWAAVAALGADDEARGASCHRAAIPLLSRSGRSELERRSHEALVDLALDAGSLEEARQHLEEAERLLGEAPPAEEAAQLWERHSRLRAAGGELERAIEAMQAAVACVSGLFQPGQGGLEAMYLVDLGDLQRRAGLPEAARASYRGAERIYEAQAMGGRLRCVRERLERLDSFVPR